VQRYGAVVQESVARIRPYAVEAVAGVFALASVAEVLTANGLEQRWADVFFALCWSLPYAAWRRRPAAAPVIAAFALAAFGFVERAAINTMFLGALVTSVAFGALPDRRGRIAGWCAVVGAAAIIDYRAENPASDFFWVALIITLAWFAGVAVGTRTEQTRELREQVAAAERDRRVAAERAAAEERNRIARELHDVVAHSVSVMVVQASGVRRLLTADQEREREALLSVERIGREALNEMRRMLGVMRAGEEEKTAALAPQPGLQHLDRLIAQVEEAGLPVEVRIEGTRVDLPAGIDLSAYRIVQEGLTNALKHAHGATAEVVVRYGDDGVEVEIVDNGPGVNGSDANGQGLVGMRERVSLYGGTLDAGPRDGGGYVLRAQLPLEART
jgi:signal transduction histidine kinase